MSDSYQAVYDAVRSRVSSVNMHEAVQDALRSAFDVSYAIPAILQSIHSAVDGYSRPSVQMRPRIFIDGNQWCALYGDNLHDGVAGFGYSPELAMIDFDKNWFQRMKVTS